MEQLSPFRVASRVLACMAVVAAVGYPLVSMAQWTESARPIKFIVPFPAGGYTDAIARIVAQNLSTSLNHPTVVENKPGANGVLGTAVVAKASADGYTLLVVAPGHAANVSMVPSLPYDTLKDFVPINLLVTLPSVVVVPAASPISTFAEFLAAAKANPGKFSYGSGGNGSSQHIAMEMLKSKARISITHIPYKGSSQAEADLLGGHLDVMFSSTISAIPHVKSGKLKILAISSEKRSSVLSSVPTIAESGVPGFAAVTWLGLLAPTGTPDPMIQKLNGEVNRLMALPDVQQRIAALGAEHQDNTAKQFDTFLQKEIAEQAAVIKAAGIKAD